MQSFDHITQTIESRFPFSGYLNRNLAPYRTVYDIVGKYLKQGDELIDFGAGPCDKTAVAQLMGINCSAWDDYNDAWYLRDNAKDKILSFAETMDIRIESSFPLNTEQSRYNMVMMNDVLEHIHDSPREILNNLVASLKTDGLLFTTLPNLANIRKRLSLLRGRTNLAAYDLYYWYQGPWRGPMREYVRDDLERLCKNLGLEIECLDTTHHMLNNLPSSLHSTYKTVTRIFPDWRDTWILVARKPAGWTEKQNITDEEFAAIYGEKSRSELHSG